MAAFSEQWDRQKLDLQRCKGKVGDKRGSLWLLRVNENITLIPIKKRNLKISLTFIVVRNEQMCTSEILYSRIILNCPVTFLYILFLNDIQVIKFSFLPKVK